MSEEQFFSLCENSDEQPSPEILQLLEACASCSAKFRLHPQLESYISTCADEEMLLRLALHCNAKVRKIAAASTHLREQHVWKLACDENLEVRVSLARNNTLPVFVLETLAEDEDQHVARQASRTLDKLNSEKLTNRVIDWVFGTREIRKTG